MTEGRISRVVPRTQTRVDEPMWVLPAGVEKLDTDARSSECMYCLYTYGMQYIWYIYTYILHIL